MPEVPIKKTILALTLLLISALVLAPAHAFTGRCRLEVSGKTYLNGPCNITTERGGSFQIGTGETRRSKYFAFVYVDAEGAAEGYWNGTVTDDRAHERLGPLTRKGACWVNEDAKVCAER